MIFKDLESCFDTHMMTPHMHTYVYKLSSSMIENQTTDTAGISPMLHSTQKFVCHTTDNSP